MKKVNKAEIEWRRQLNELWASVGISEVHLLNMELHQAIMKFDIIMNRKMFKKKYYIPFLKRDNIHD